MFFCGDGFGEPRAAAEGNKDGVISLGGARKHSLPVTAPSRSRTFPVTMLVDEIYLGNPVS
jgi:hypothetical protein